MQYQKVNVTEYTNNEKWDCDTMPEIEGVLVDKKTGVGTFNKNLYILKSLDDKEYAIWGTANLDRTLGTMLTGSQVKIVYLGKKKTKSGGMFKSFEVYQAVGEPETPKQTTTIEVEKKPKPAPKKSAPKKEEAPVVDDQLTEDDCPF